MFRFFAEAWRFFRIDGEALDRALCMSMIGARWGQRTFVQFTPDGKHRIYQCPAGKYQFDDGSVYIYVPSCRDNVNGPVKSGYLDRHPNQALAALAVMDSAAVYVTNHMQGQPERTAQEKHASDLIMQRRIALGL